MVIQITETELKALNAALIEAADIDLRTKQLAISKDANRQFLLDFLTGLNVPADQINKVVPGVSTQNKTTPKLDASAALAYALNPENFAHSAPLLSVRADCVGVVIAAAMTDERLRPIFELNMSGAQAAVRNGSHVGLPVIQIMTETAVAVRVLDLKTGDALREMFEVVPDVNPTPDALIIEAAQAPELDF